MIYGLCRLRLGFSHVCDNVRRIIPPLPRRDRVCHRTGVDLMWCGDRSDLSERTPVRYGDQSTHSTVLGYQKVFAFKKSLTLSPSNWMILLQPNKKRRQSGLEGGTKKSIFLYGGRVIFCSFQKLNVCGKVIFIPRPTSCGSSSEIM